MSSETNKKNEFDFIKEQLRPLTYGKKEARNLIDDCAFFNNVKGLTVSVDSSIEGVHVPTGTAIEIQSKRSVLRALSDLAAFGAKPLCVFIAINLPKGIKHRFLEKISLGLEIVLSEYNIFLAGGDISSYEGPVSFSVTVVGEKAGKISGRSGAKKGDLVVMTGNLGDAYMGRMLIQNNNYNIDKKETKDLINKFYNPLPRINLGMKVNKYATSIIDISDGFLSELRHICINSKVRASINIDKLSLSKVVKSLINIKKVKYFDILTGGDDYELLYTINPINIARLDDESSVIGQIVEGSEIKILDKNSLALKFENKELGYKHF